MLAILRSWANVLRCVHHAYSTLLDDEEKKEIKNILTKSWKSSTVALQRMLPPGLGAVPMCAEEKDAGAWKSLVTAFALPHTTVAWVPPNWACLLLNIHIYMCGNTHTYIYTLSQVNKHKYQLKIKAFIYTRIHRYNCRMLSGLKDQYTYTLIYEGHSWCHKTSFSTDRVSRNQVLVQKAERCSIFKMFAD